MIEAIITREHSYRMPYSVGVRVPSGHDLVFVAGLNALPLYHEHPHDLDALEFPEDPAEQTDVVLEAMGEVLAGAGGTLADVVRLDAFITNMAFQDAVARSLGGHFAGDRPPAMSLIAVRELVVPGLLVEINAIAAIKAA
ncbi:MAG TPA: Rid family hydrolase [Solirubrobacteraceae bacterium]|nr:Rid family hydrolase [Solirubrobacteraceae bacterium]